MAKVLRKRYGCATEFTLDVLGGKWKTVLLGHLKERPLRYGELRTLASGLSDKMLTERLREMEELGLITRQFGAASSGVPGGTPVCLYHLTVRGESLRAVLGSLYAWGQQHGDEFGVTCAG